MSYNIVTVNVSQTIGATPSNLQQMSAVLSFGATFQEAGKPVLLTKSSDISDLVNNPISSLTAEAASFGSDFTLVLPFTNSINRDPGSEVQITLQKCSPNAWNGTYLATVVDSKTLSWTVPGSTLDGQPTTVGTFSLIGSDDLVTAVDTFFAQGNSVGTYLLELGYQDDLPKNEVAALKTYMQEPLKRFYAYLVPENWNANADFINLAKLYTANEAKQYFFVLEDTPDDTNYVTPYAGIKSIIAMADDTYPETNAAAAAMWNFVSPSPSEINKVPPMA
ncbi:MAG: hypothetical protein E7J89_25780, partial [Enterobacter asburiae]|nr:hypothetical protein [Enterobacter asburiae]